MKKAAVREDGEAPLTIITMNKVVKDTHECHQNGSRWRPKRCSVARAGPSSPASCIVYMKRCTILFTSFYSLLSFLRQPGRERDCPSNYSTIFWCRSRFSSCQPLPETLSWSFPCSIDVWWPWGTSRSQCWVLRLQLHIPLSHLCSRITANPLRVFTLISSLCFLPPRTSLPLSRLSLHSNMWTIPLSLCIYQLSLLPPFSIRAYSFLYSVSIFSHQH